MTSTATSFFSQPKVKFNITIISLLWRTSFNEASKRNLIGELEDDQTKTLIFASKQKQIPTFTSANVASYISIGNLNSCTIKKKRNSSRKKMLR